MHARILASSFVVSTLSVLASACFAPPMEASGDGIAPPRELFTPDAPPAPNCPPDPSARSTLRIQVRTSPVGGRFAPRNVGVIWIERADGTFVKTIERWGVARAKYLVAFIASSNGNVVDAITSATLLSHQTHTRTWDLTDTTDCEVEPGDYRVRVEHTDRDGPGAATSLPLTIADAMTSTFPDEPTFHDLQLDLE